MYEGNKAHRLIAAPDKNLTCFVVRRAIPFVELVAQTKGLSPRPIRQFLPCSADELQFHGCYAKFEVVKILLRNLEFGSFVDKGWEGTLCEGPMAVEERGGTSTVG